MLTLEPNRKGGYTHQEGLWGRRFYGVLMCDVTRVLADCPACGTRKVAFKEHTVHTAYGPKKQHKNQVREWSRETGRGLGQCAGCAQYVPAREVKTPRHLNAGQGHKCDGRCLNGKTSCGCRCAGFCHGAGACRCGTPEAAAYLRSVGMMA